MEDEMRIIVYLLDKQLETTAIFEKVPFEKTQSKLDVKSCFK